jgi:hypothetical protein
MYKGGTTQRGELAEEEKQQHCFAQWEAGGKERKKNR